MKSPAINLFLADDDVDDCLLFKEAIDELPIPIKLTTVNDGEQLMHLLSEKKIKPSVLFIDLNMPRKNGYECLKEIKKIKFLEKIPVIVYSTSFEQRMINLLYEHGAFHYIHKPADFSKLKSVLRRALEMIVHPGIMNVITEKEKFILEP